MLHLSVGFGVDALLCTHLGLGSFRVMCVSKQLLRFIRPASLKWRQCKMVQIFDIWVHFVCFNKAKSDASVHVDFRVEDVNWRTVV